METRIRIKDIADRAGISPGTVDRVIHDRGNVSPETKKKVMEVMEELGYKPNIIARTLANNKIQRIVALIPDPTGDLYWDQPKMGIEKALRAVQHYGIEVRIAYFDRFDPASFQQKAIQILEETSPLDAILFTPIFQQESRELLDACKEREIPNVMINTNIENSGSLCYIGQDSFQSGVLGARLLDFGLHDGETALILNLDKRITNAKHLQDKESGFRDYFSKVTNKHIHIVRKDFEEFGDRDKLRAFLQRQLAENPRLSGIFVTNSRAYKVAEALDDADLERIKIVGYDLIQPNLDLLKCNKINFIINQNPVQQGYLGIMNLFNHLIMKHEVAPLQYLPLDIVVVENVEYYLKRELEFQIVL